MNHVDATAPQERLVGAIMIVDDIPANLRMLMEILKSQQHVVRPVSHGHLALVSAQTQPPDLILLDIMMPEISGYEICRQLKNDARTRDIPIIFISAKDDIQDKAYAFQIGGVDYITKPFQADEVLLRVHTHLKLSRLQRSLQKQNSILQQEIRQRQEAEEAVRQMNARLEQRVRERTAELEAANDDLRNVISTVSHDLKTPLRGIGQLAQWLKDDYSHLFDARAQEMLSWLVQRVKRMNSLLDGIAEYISIVRQPEKVKPIDLNALIPQIFENLMPPETIVCCILTPLPVISGKKEHLSALFGNLIDNAILFMGRPQGQVTIACRDHGGFWQFEVADNGAGIPAEYHDKIFHLFQTLHTHDNDKQIGLGLAIVKKIITLYGGTIWVESELNQGSKFFFTLPKSS
ncbi:response regulator receiver sensor signal transduction histidine kinase [Candidatus Moduliflexus flocculans]|uniref:histidine kinase n=1 Tax=Candidatus Moduliflexus flocculans TaxID=1499966 RepID=A0A0S6VYA6_9BACT|nr:response regulator receiver sensor signal transduction histidine kinase [Candidatus Moduliflexus flocculans]